MSDKDKLKNYLNKISKKIIEDENILNQLILVKKILLSTIKSKKKVLIFGNGGSAAISSHVSVDLTKNTKIKAINFNEADLITCFSNDYGYQNWVSKAIDFYADKNDVLILISSSGKSKNMLNACKAAKRKKIKNIITFTGNKKNNPLSKLGDVNLWVNSDIYNYIENVHQIWLLSICDLIKLNKIN
jgi:D-sedoheptulose 7-phosphate isomerase